MCVCVWGGQLPWAHVHVEAETDVSRHSPASSTSFAKAGALEQTQSSALMTPCFASETGIVGELQGPPGMNASEANHLAISPALNYIF